MQVFKSSERMEAQSSSQTWLTGMMPSIYFSQSARTLISGLRSNIEVTLHYLKHLIGFIFQFFNPLYTFSALRFLSCSSLLSGNGFLISEFLSSVYHWHSSRISFTLDTLLFIFIISQPSHLVIYCSCLSSDLRSV